MIDVLVQIPGLLLVVGALFLPLFRGPLAKLQPLVMLALPVISLMLMWPMEYGTRLGTIFYGYELVPVHVDRLSWLFGLVFHIAAILSALYALHVKDVMQHVSGLAYAGAAIAAAFAGDLISLFVYWELTAITSVFLIWASRNEESFQTGIRYLLIQVGSGVILLAGVLFHFADAGTLIFSRDALHGAGAAATLQWGDFSLGVKLILIAFGIKAAFPLLHNWLQDAYPKATPTGTVFLSAFTTKLAIYALARGFAGTEMLIPIGCVMTIFPIFFAAIENDLRKVLAYSLNNQLGFMVVGVGIGTALSINGAAAHAFAHILYKGLLFMAMGAVMHRVGTTKASELGGLYKSMPWTTIFCIIGAMSISAFPLMSGFTTKSMIMSAAAEGHMLIVWLVLLFASAGVMEHSGIKIPFFAFFAHDSGKRCEEAPWNMLVAMGIAAAFCIGIGVYPDPLYQILPTASDYPAYTSTHVIGQLQLLIFSILAFAVLFRSGIYPAEIKATNLDFEWVYRRLVPGIVKRVARVASAATGLMWATLIAFARFDIQLARRSHGPDSRLARTFGSGQIGLAAVGLLGLYLLFYG